MSIFDQVLVVKSFDNQKPGWTIYIMIVNQIWKIVAVDVIPYGLSARMNHFYELNVIYMKFAKCLILVLIKERSLIESKPKITVKAWILSDILMLPEFVLLHFEQQTLGSSLHKKGSMLKYSGEWPYGYTHGWVCLLLYGTVKWNSGQHREWVKSISYFNFLSESCF